MDLTFPSNLTFLLTDFAGKPAWMWLGFLTLVAVLMALDLGVLHRRSREIGVGESLALSSFYIVLALAFGLFVWQSFGAEAAAAYLTAFAVEKALAMDNVFVIAMIFAALATPRALQHRSDRSARAVDRRRRGSGRAGELDLAGLRCPSDLHWLEDVVCGGEAART
jgi:tellurite resistance protein TerC